MHCNVFAEYLTFLGYEEFGMNIHIECRSSVVSSLCLYLKGPSFGLGLEASYPYPLWVFFSVPQIVGIVPRNNLCIYTSFPIHHLQTTPNFTLCIIYSSESRVKLAEEHVLLSYNVFM
jgi:hypothetical protein